jgi:DNA-directed RNA polymerase sigma subunit (sigma70/sigma32)
MTAAPTACGACPGCELAATIRRAMAEINAFFAPEIAQASEVLAAATEQERELLPRKQHRTARAHRALRELVDEHQRFIGKTARAFPWAVCCRVPIHGGAEA